MHRGWYQKPERTISTQQNGNDGVFWAPDACTTVTARPPTLQKLSTPAPPSALWSRFPFGSFPPRPLPTSRCCPSCGKHRKGHSPSRCPRADAPIAQACGPLLSARPTFHSEDIQRGRRSANQSLLGPQRSAAAHPRDGDAWRVGHRPLPAAQPLIRSGFGDSRKEAQKTGAESVQNGPTHAYLNKKIATFIYR
jgi:hypothetical protein